MNYCSNCGNPLEGSKKFCPSCGIAVAMSYTDPSSNYSHENTANYNQSMHQRQSQHEYQNYSQNRTCPGGTDRLEDQTIMMSALAYIIVLIPLLTNAHKTSDVIKFHTNQGLVLLIACIIWATIRAILAAILYTIPYFGWMAGSLLNLVWIGFAVLFIVGIMNAINNRMKPLPVIGKFTILK